MPDQVDSDKGTYLLLAQLVQPTELAIGRLGNFAFGKGWYAYAGSALGPGGLQARLARHAREQKRVHWHVDYLLGHARLLQSWQLACPIRLECGWAAALLRLPEARVAVRHFGASDCRCPGHLIYWPSRPQKDQIEATLRAAAPDGCDLRLTIYAQ